MHGNLQLSSTQTVRPSESRAPDEIEVRAQRATTRRLLRSTATKPDEQIENPTCGNDTVPSLFAHVFLVQHDNRERNGGNADPSQNPQPRFAPLRGLSRGLLGLGRDLGLESWLGGWLIVGLLRRKRCLRRFRLSPLTTLLEFVPSLFCPVELDFLNLVIYRQGGTAIAAESHFLSMSTSSRAPQPGQVRLTIFTRIPFASRAPRRKSGNRAPASLRAVLTSFPVLANEALQV